MVVIGLNSGEINSSAALVVNGVLKNAAQEERFNRQKFTSLFPSNSLEFCLQDAGLRFKDCDYVAQAWNPGAAWHKFDGLRSAHRRDRSEYFYSIPDNLFKHADRAPGDWVQMSFSSGLPPVYFVQHHLSHAANAFFMSQMEEAAILTCDFRGEFECTTFGMGQGNGLKIFDKQQLPHSLGLLYATFTELLGYKPDNDEWKVMALSAFDVDASKIIEKIKTTYRLLENGKLELDESYYKGTHIDTPKLYTQKLVDLLGGREALPGEELDEWMLCVAKGMQTVAEEIASHYLAHLYEYTRCENLVVGGGFFMNSVFNGKVLDRSSFKRFQVPFAPSDAGNSIGAALYVSHVIHGQARKLPSWSSPYLGPKFDDKAIEEVLVRRHISSRYEKNSALKTAELLARGQVVAVFQGRMEFGDRALGNRSILADPRNPLVKDRINSAIKYRESYRPFAPVVLEDKAQVYFDVPEGFQSHYMEKVRPIRKEFHEKLPAVTHVDGSGRLQTVTKDTNPWLFDVVTQFEKITGVPIILNTSFNVNGEPIVRTPDDAISNFFNSGLENLVLGCHFVDKG
jgi:carbamoyltransferase